MMVTAAEKTGEGNAEVIYATGDLGVYGPSRLILGGHENNNKEGAKYKTRDADPLIQSFFNSFLITNVLSPSLLDVTSWMSRIAWRPWRESLFFASTT